MAMAKENLVLLPKSEYLKKENGKTTYINQYWLTSKDGGIAFYVTPYSAAPQSNRDEKVARIILEKYKYPVELFVRQIPLVMAFPSEFTSRWEQIRKRYSLAALEKPTEEEITLMRNFLSGSRDVFMDEVRVANPEMAEFLADAAGRYLSDEDVAELVRAAKMQDVFTEDGECHSKWDEVLASENPVSHMRM